MERGTKGGGVARQPCSVIDNRNQRMKKYRIKVKVVKILEKGTCPDGLKVGDEFVFERTPPPNFCHWAYYSILPFITALRFGGNIPWEEKEGTCRLCCSDPDNPVVFEISRVEE
jgi:uncharacterized repeat protein (TIGR04076 family)